MLPYDRERGVPKTRESRALALVPVTICVVLLALMMPRATKPDAVPLPAVDERALAEVVVADRGRAARARVERLPPDVLALGSAFRAMQVADASKADEAVVAKVRADLDVAARVVKARGESLGAVVDLRATQLEGFLAEVRAFEASGEVSHELQELGGAFVERMRVAGWVEGNHVVPDESQLRAAYKTMWNGLVGDLTKEQALSLDEQRALFSLYIAHPHPPEANRDEIAAERRDARTEADCERAAVNERRIVEKWREGKIRQLGRLDPSYPTDYALGVSFFRGEQFDLSARAFRAWIDAHPDGPYALRAKNHLKAATDASGAF